MILSVEAGLLAANAAITVIDARDPEIDTEIAAI